MDGRNGENAPINSFALVSYLPEPLAEFLDRLRSDLAQEHPTKAHVTVLPPRPVSGPPERAWQEIKTSLKNFDPFCVELGQIEVFRETRVLYLGIGPGFAQLDRLHRELNRGLLKFDEPFRYLPHVTIAKDIGTQFLSAAKMATRRWREFPHSRRFTVDRLTFVRNTQDNRWMDLYARRLAAAT